MNTTNPNYTSTRTLALRAPILAAAASLLFAPCLFAQTPAPSAKESPLRALPEGHPLKTLAQGNLYSMKFSGVEILSLFRTLHETFPGDNFVINGPSERLPMPAFELRNVRLAEIGRTIEFLSEGQLKVEIVENAGAGNIWRIGRNSAAEAAASVKMRAVAAPHLFADEGKVKDIIDSAKEMEERRLELGVVRERARGEFRPTNVSSLKSQGIFVIIGDEDGVAGVESVIKAAEQRLAESAAAKVAAIAAYTPKTRAVLAPHVFAEEKRLESVRITLGEMRDRLGWMDEEIRKVTGSEAVRVAWANAEPRKEQKVFLLLGTEAAIAGMESLIKAAEQLATEEDAIRDAEMRAVRAAKEAARQKDEAVVRKAEDEAALKKAEDRAKAEKREQ